MSRPRTKLRVFSDQSGLLDAEIETFMALLAVRQDDGKSDVIEAVRSLLTDAERANAAGNPQSGWLLFKAARREMVKACDEEQLRAQLISVREEAALSVGGWEKRAILELVERATEQINGDLSEAQSGLMQAMKLRDSFFDRLHETKDRVRVRIQTLLITLTAIIVGPFLCYAAGFYGEMTIEKYFAYDDSLPPISIFGLTIAAMSGSIGATLGALMDYINRGKIPNAFTTILAVAARPTIGGICGGSAIFFAHSGVTEIITSASSVTLLAFAFGFSERIFLGAMNRIGPTEEAARTR